MNLDDIIRAARELADADTPTHGSTARDVCRAGLHDMSTHGRQIWRGAVKNGRYCIGCKRVRQRTPGGVERLGAQKPRRVA